MDNDFKAVGKPRTRPTSKVVGERLNHLLDTAPALAVPTGVQALNPGYFHLQHLRKHEKPKAAPIKLKEI